MGESISHIRLVEALYKQIAITFFNGDTGPILVDHPESRPTEKPPRIYDFVPDIYASNIDDSLLVIGEAKTSKDLESNHTFNQLKAFLSFCALHKNSNFVFAVRWEMVPLARAIIKTINKEIVKSDTNITILEKLSC